MVDVLLEINYYSCGDYGLTVFLSAGFFELSMHMFDVLFVDLIHPLFFFLGYSGVMAYIVVKVSLKYKN